MQTKRGLYGHGLYQGLRRSRGLGGHSPVFLCQGPEEGAMLRLD